MLTLITGIEEFSLLLVSHALEIANSLGAAIGQLTGSLKVSDGAKVHLVVENLGADAWLFVSENASVHENLIRDRFAHLATIVTSLSAFDHLIFLRFICI